MRDSHIGVGRAQIPDLGLRPASFLTRLRSPENQWLWLGMFLASSGAQTTFRNGGEWYELRGCGVSGEAISGAPSRSLENRNNVLATCSGCAPSTYVSHTTGAWPPSHPCCSQQHLAWAQILCPISCSKVGRAGLIGFT